MSDERESARAEQRAREVRIAPIRRQVERQFEDWTERLFENVESNFPDVSDEDMLYAMGSAFTDLRDSYQDWLDDSKENGL